MAPLDRERRVRQEEPRNWVDFREKAWWKAARDATTYGEATTRSTLGSDSHAEVTTEVRVRGDMDKGGAGAVARDLPMAMTMVISMEIRTAVIPTAVDTTSMATLEPLERNMNGKLRRRNEALESVVGPGDWRSRMERTAQQQARELPQLHRTVAKMALMTVTLTALQEGQW